MAVNINIPSQVSQNITEGVTTTAPSEDAVAHALTLKANTADLGATAFSNDYNDLDNLPTIPAAQIQSDWNQSNNTALDYIKNKPTIPSVTGFVPYTGATSDVDLGTYNLTADHISLNVSPSGAGFGVGATQWNNTIGSSETLLKGGNVTLKNGVDLVARIVNKVTPNTTLTKAAYQAVKVSGATGGRLSIGLAQANTDLNSADTIGLVCETIATNQEGFILTVGQLLDINTTGSLQGETWADGDVLYLSPTTAGRLTNIKPTGATGHIVVIGYVEYAHANNGAIYVKIMNGWELDELHNVYITNPTGGAGLEYQASTQLWIDAGLQYTIELIDALTVNFYAPYNMVITSVSNVLNSPTITLQDDNVAYTLGNTIAIGSKVTVTASVASVVNLNITK
jgi:nitrogen fixation protein